MCTDRRDFLRLSAAVAGTSLLGNLARANSAEPVAFQQRDLPDPIRKLRKMTDGQIKNTADIYDNMTQAEANQIAGMWRAKKEEAEAAPAEATQ